MFLSSLAVFSRFRFNRHLFCTFYQAPSSFDPNRIIRIINLCVGLFKRWYHLLRCLLWRHWWCAWKRPRFRDPTRRNRCFDCSFLAKCRNFPKVHLQFEFYSTRDCCLTCSLVAEDKSFEHGASVCEEALEEVPWFRHGCWHSCWCHQFSCSFPSHQFLALDGLVSRWLVGVEEGDAGCFRHRWSLDAWFRFDWAFWKFLFYSAIREVMFSSIVTSYYLFIWCWRLKYVDTLLLLPSFLCVSVCFLCDENCFSNGKNEPRQRSCKSESFLWSCRICSVIVISAYFWFVDRIQIGCIQRL